MSAPPPSPGQATPQRAIRLFLSSTFRDMQAEREELLKRVLPQVRKLCQQRGVSWNEVDLRWGITEEQAQRGAVLPVCLAEIDRCRPFFLCLLGERYGWVPGPERIPAELRARYPWLDDHLDDSVTEMEVRHAVLNQPGQPVHTFFYFRDPAYLDRLPSGARRQDYACENDTARQKLAALKDEIRRSGQPVCEPYRDAVELGQRVLADLTALIDRLFPAGSEPEPLDREAAEHDAFGRSRLGVYIGRPDYFDRLDAFANTSPQRQQGDAPTSPQRQQGEAGPGVGLLVLGESGSGKSALLANWLHRYRSEHPDEVVLYHAIGATPQSADGSAMLRRLLGEFRRRLGVQAEVPSKPVELQQAFAGALYQAAARGKVVLVLDALNQMEDRDGMPDLLWLPPELPANVRLIVSTLPGRSLDELTRRQWPTLAVKPLEAEERTRLIVECLRQASKALSEERVRRLASAEQTANPLFLRALLEELRVFGAHERLDERIAYYLGAASLEALFARILERYEADYERERPGLVRAAMTLLWAARRGLAEEELLQVLGDGRTGEPLPQAYWSPLYLAAEHALTNRGGLIGFFHDYLRRAVEQRYLPEAEQRRAAHRKLAWFFAGGERDPRTVDELPWQLAQAEAWEGLYGLLTDLDFFQRAWDVNEFEVKTYWVEVEGRSARRMVEGYQPVLTNPNDHLEHLWAVAGLLTDMGYRAEALPLCEFQENYHRRIGDLNGWSRSLGNLAIILYWRGDLDKAMNILKEGERLERQLGRFDHLSRTLGNQAKILAAWGDLAGSLALQKEGERLCRQLGDLSNLQINLGNQALILATQGDLDGAEILHQEEERLCRQLGNLGGLSRSLGNQAVIWYKRRNLDKMMALIKEGERIERQLGNLDGLQASLCNQAVILWERGDLDGAMALWNEQERLCRRIENLEGLVTSLQNQAEVLGLHLGQGEAAFRLLKEAAQLCLRHGLRAEGEDIEVLRQKLTAATQGRDGIEPAHPRG
jgi:tetratricopeptide (TPR) repeat protein